MYPHPWPKSQFSQCLNTWRGKDKVSSLFTPHTPKGPWTSSHYRKEPTYYFKLLLCINDSKALQTASEWHVWFVCACPLQLKGSSCSWSPNRWSAAISAIFRAPVTFICWTIVPIIDWAPCSTIIRAWSTPAIHWTRRSPIRTFPTPTVTSSPRAVIFITVIPQSILNRHHPV